MPGPVSSFGAPAYLRRASLIDPTLEFGLSPYFFFWAENLRGTYADGATVTTWEDKGSEGRDLSATNTPVFDAVNANLNGHASVNFATADTDYLQTANWSTTYDQPITVAVYRFTSTGQGQYLFDGNDLGARNYVSLTSADAYRINRGTNLTGSNGVGDTTAHVATVGQLDPSNAYLTVDGAAIISPGDAGTTAWDGLTVGAAANGTSPADLEVAFLMGLALGEWFTKATEVAELVAWLTEFYGI